MKEENEKVKRRCPVCDTELDESEDVCPNCGCYVEEPAYDIESDLG